MAKKISFLKGNLCIHKCFIDVLYIFSSVLKKNYEIKCAPIWDGFCVEFCHVLSQFHLREWIHNPDSVFPIALKDYLFGFWIKIFKKRLLCLLFWVCSFIKLAQNTIVTTTSKPNLSLNASHIHYTHHFLLRCQAQVLALFVTQLLNFIRKYFLLFILDF